MKVDTIPADTTVRAIARSEFLPGGSTAVLVIHGFTGITDEMHYLAERLNTAGFTVAVPRLPGHGTNWRDFVSTDAEDWLRRVTDAYLELSSRYEKVFVTGLSMGGVLSVILAARFPIERIALAAPALKVRQRLVCLTPLLKFFIRRLPSAYQEKSDDPDRQFLFNEYWHWNTPSAIAELYRLLRRARRLLPRVRAQVLTIVSRADETVPITAAELIERRGTAAAEHRQVILENSPHVMVNGEEKERVADEIVRWFS
jgi:carboxylesterase